MHSQDYLFEVKWKLPLLVPERLASPEPPIWYSNAQPRKMKRFNSSAILTPVTTCPCPLRDRRICIYFVSAGGSCVEYSDLSPESKKKLFLGPNQPTE